MNDNFNSQENSEKKNFSESIDHGQTAAGQRSEPNYYEQAQAAYRSEIPNRSYENIPRYVSNTQNNFAEGHANPGYYHNPPRYETPNTYYAENSASSKTANEEEIRRIIREEVKKSKPKFRWLKILALILVGTILGSGVTFALYGTGFLRTNDQMPQKSDAEITKPEDNSEKQQTQYHNIEINPDGENTIENVVANKAIPSIVGITALVPGQHNPFYFYNEVPKYVDAVGSGVIVDSNGYIVTNSHVISNGDAKDITVTFSDGETAKADVIWKDPTLDLAIIKVDKTGLPVAELGDSDMVEVGDKAIAVGNPLGLDLQSTLTSGYISGLNRTINVMGGNIMDGLIQTDAAINGGNSGGALLNAKGQVIGINTARPQTADGIGFAIPINAAKPIIEKIVENGSFESVYIGIVGFNAQMLVQATDEDLPTEKGVVVNEVLANSAAAKAGIKQGDIIVSIDGAEVDSMNSLKTQLLKYDYGDSAKIVFYRDKDKKEVEIQFVEFDNDAAKNQ